MIKKQESSVEWTEENTRKYIKFFLLAAGLTQKDAAELLGWSQQNFANKLAKGTLRLHDWLVLLQKNDYTSIPSSKSGHINDIIIASLLTNSKNPEAVADFVRDDLNKYHKTGEDSELIKNLRAKKKETTTND